MCVDIMIWIEICLNVSQQSTGLFKLKLKTLYYTFCNLFINNS